MTVFIIVAVIALAGLIFRLTAIRHLTSPPVFRETWNIWTGWTRTQYPGWTRWVFLGWAAAFLYLAASGLFFAIFIRRGLFGLPLLAHVMAGGLFAVGLAAVMILRAGAHRFDRRESAVFEHFSCPIFKNLSKEFVRKVIFWTVGFLGFIQVTTALCSMLPVFTFKTQVALLMIHRFSALGLALAAILFVDLMLPDRTESPRA